MKNVLFVLTDDQRYDCLGAFGNSDCITPNLDKLAESGTLFTQAHIPCGTAVAICMPSRAMLNTGRTLFHLKDEGQTIPDTHTLMGESFKNSGYEAFGTGKWHNGPPAFTRSFHKGDNAFFGGSWDHWNVPVCYYDPTGAYDNVVNFVMNFYGNDKVTKIHCDKFNPGVHSTELLTNTAIEYLNGRKGSDSPFFLYLAYLAPHDPRTMPERFMKMYDPEKIKLPGNIMGAHPFSFGIENARDELLMPWPREENEIRRQLAAYYAMVSHLDYELGRVIETLKSNGELDNTIIVFTSDNGLAVGSHGLLGKQNVYDHSVRVPLIISGPGLPKGQRRDGYVYLHDIYPTLMELCGIEKPPSVEGISFAGMFNDPKFHTRETLYFAYNDLIRCVKDSRFKLVEYRNYTKRQQTFDLIKNPTNKIPDITNVKRTQLFDLKNNPEETVDLSRNPQYAADVKRLREVLMKYKTEWEDSGHKYSKAYWDAY